MPPSHEAHEGIPCLGFSPRCTTAGLFLHFLEFEPEDQYLSITLGRLQNLAQGGFLFQPEGGQVRGCACGSREAWNCPTSRGSVRGLRVGRFGSQAPLV